MKFTHVKKGNPKHAFAFKMVLSDQVVEAKVVDVIWTPSKDGYLKPRVRIEPVIIGGAKIEYATAFNGAFVEKNKIGVGAVIQLIRSGDVIPHIMDVITPAPEAKMPDVDYEWNPTHVDIILKDAKSDIIVQEKNITGFFTKLGVDGLSIGNVKRLMKGGFNTIAKILKMKKEDFLKVEGFKDKLATKIHTSIHAQIDTVGMAKLMAATNLFGRGMGEKRIQAVLDEYPNIVLSKESIDEKALKVSSLKGFAKKTADAFVNHISEFLAFIDETGLLRKLKKASSEVKAEAKAKAKIDTSHPLFGKKIVITGFRDKELEEYIKSKGGKIATSVSKNTSMVIVKSMDEDTGKAEKARALKIPLITLEMFQKTKGH